MKTRRALLLSNTYPTSRHSLFDNSQMKRSSQKQRKRKNLKAIDQGSIKSKLLSNLHQLANQFSNNQSLLNGPLRHLKVEPHYREPTSRLLQSRQEYRETSKIRLTGNWIKTAGFITHERIQVIPMHRMLIIVPETEN
jgi:hypothetical protein